VPQSRSQLELQLRRGGVHLVGELLDKIGKLGGQAAAVRPCTVGPLADGGRMSLVDPRPPLPSDAAQCPRHVRRRLLVKARLTGPWQISGRSDLTWQEPVRVDLCYVEKWLLAWDLMILLKTVMAVVRAEELNEPGDLEPNADGAMSPAATLPMRRHSPLPSRSPPCRGKVLFSCRARGQWAG
jgi:hypothetical protein